MAVAATVDILNQIVQADDTPAAYATAGVNGRIMASSDPALAAMCPELSAAQRRAWIL